MDFSINITLFLQIIHFYIAYLMLRKWLLKPAFDVLVEQENEAAVLVDQLNDQAIEIQEKKDLLVRNWNSAQRVFSTFFIKCISMVGKDPVSQICIARLDTNEKKALEKDLKQYILDRIKSV